MSANASVCNARRRGPNARRPARNGIKPISTVRWPNPKDVLPANCSVRQGRPDRTMQNAGVVRRWTAAAPTQSIPIDRGAMGQCAPVFRRNERNHDRWDADREPGIRIGVLRDRRRGGLPRHSGVGRKEGFVRQAGGELPRRGLKGISGLRQRDCGTDADGSPMVEQGRCARCHSVVAVVALRGQPDIFTLG